MTGLRARARSVLAAALNRFRPPAGSHHAMPEDAGVPEPRPPDDDTGWPVSPGQMTRLDIPPPHARPYVPEQRRGGRHES